jgi:hypothetical protein
MRLPNVSAARLTLPELNAALARKLAIVLPILFALTTAGMSASASFHDRFNWVPISNDNIVLDSVLKLCLALILLAVAVLVTLPLALATHVAGHNPDHRADQRRHRQVFRRRFFQSGTRGEVRCAFQCRLQDPS